MIDTKICKTCGLEKLIEDFYFADKRRGHRATNCKPCFIKHSESHRKKRGEAIYLAGGFPPDPNVSEIKCITCQETLSVINFGKDRLHKTGYKRNCKNCDKNYRYKNKERIASRKLFLTYGIDSEQKDYILKNNQNGKCPICKTTEPGKLGWVIDHCHDTGIIRGVTCSTCNSMIGLAKDSLIILNSAIEYLIKSKSVNYGVIKSPKGRNTRRSYHKNINNKSLPKTRVDRRNELDAAILSWLDSHNRKAPSEASQNGKLYMGFTERNLAMNLKARKKSRPDFMFQVNKTGGIFKHEDPVSKKNKLLEYYKINNKWPSRSSKNKSERELAEALRRYTYKKAKCFDQKFMESCKLLESQKEYGK